MEEKERTTGVILDECIVDAAGRLTKPPVDGPQIPLFVHSSWPQVWPDRSCGHSVMVRAIGEKPDLVFAPTILVGSVYGKDMCVYHAGKFAYWVREPNDSFFLAMANRKLIGAVEYFNRQKPYEGGIVRLNTVPASIMIH